MVSSPTATESLSQLTCFASSCFITVAATHSQTSMTIICDSHLDVINLRLNSECITLVTYLLFLRLQELVNIGWKWARLLLKCSVSLASMIGYITSQAI